ncbi:hypothetical protein D210916BOD24_31280 [Alteromonas sp. D210916BOD_24]|uniref:hypothetical protein n=1 Tax=Alteromonas sp. D210916BOD_24 TaxID=3157618 RepID=UPI00399C99A2
MKKTILVVTTSLFISACAHKPAPLDMEEVFFETKINQDGTKLFAFSLPLLRHREGNRDDTRKGEGMPGQGERKENNVGAMPGRGAGTPPHNRNKYFYAALDKKLEQTAYCRTGYIEIDTHQTEDRLHLLGECKETATELDEMAFPNPH